MRIFSYYKKAITPPYKPADIPAIVFTLLILFMFTTTILAVSVLRRDANHYQRHAHAVRNTVESKNGTLAGNTTVGSDPNASGGKYVLLGTAIPENAIHANDYGTTGNGTTDDTQALQAAANAANGKTLYIEPGMYLTSGITVNGPTRVMATGATLKASGGSAPLMLVQKATRIEGIGLDGNGKPKAGIYTAPLVSGITVTGCNINTITYDPGAIVMDHATHFQITNCTIDGSGVDAIAVYYSSHGQINYNTITNSGRHGIEWWGSDSNLGNSGYSGQIGVSDITFIGNTVKNVEGAIWGSMGQHITITNNFVEECRDVCLDAEGGSDFTIKDNYVHNGRHGGITLFFAASYAVIDHNIVVQDAGYDAGVKTYSRPASGHCSMTNNTITTNDSDGFLILRRTLENSTVTGNDITLNGGGQGVNVYPGNNTNTFSPNTVHQRSAPKN